MLQLKIGGLQLEMKSGKVISVLRLQEMPSHDCLWAQEKNHCVMYTTPLVLALLQV